MKDLYFPGEEIEFTIATHNPSTGAAAAASAIAGTLLKNNVATVVPVVVTLVTGKTNIYGVTCTLPSGGAAYAVGDDISITIAATVAGVSDENPMFSGKIGYAVATDSSGRVTLIPANITAMATAIWETLTSAVTLDGSFGKRIKDIASDVANAILVTPANKLATDGTGRVTAGTVGDKDGYTLSVPGILAFWNRVKSGFDVGSMGAWLEAQLNFTYVAPNNQGIIDANTALGTLSDNVTAVNENVTEVGEAVTTVGNAVNAVGELVEAIPETDLTGIEETLDDIRENTDKWTNITAADIEIANELAVGKSTIESNVLKVYEANGTTVRKAWTLTPISGNAGYSARTPQA